MAKSMSKSALIGHLAEKSELSRKQVAGVLDTLITTAYKEAKNTFTLPGLGKLVLSERPARKMVMRFGPKAGQEIMVPKKKVLKFRVAKACKEAVLGAKKK